MLDRDIQHEVGIICIFENKANTWQEVPIAMKAQNCTSKEFFVIKGNRHVRNTAKRIKQTLAVNMRKLI